MSKSATRSSPPDSAERERALDAGKSILVQAPAGSGKTNLLARRFLRLLGEVDDPGEIVAITFTKAASAEMRHRILSELENAGGEDAATPEEKDEFSMASLARRALNRSQQRGWDLLETPAQLRISTIDSFCRELALQKPLLSGLGGGISIHEQPAELYRRAARKALEAIDAGGPLGAAIEALLLWRDNNWKDLEDQLVGMLQSRDRWMHDFVLTREPDWDELRARLERPFANAVRAGLAEIVELLNFIEGVQKEVLDLARFACEEPGEKSPWGLAECAEIPSALFPNNESLENAREVFSCISEFLQTKKGAWRSEKGLQTADGFPSTPRGKSGKARFSQLISKLKSIPELEMKLAAICDLPPAHYTEDEWQIVQACFTLLRRAAAELQVVFAEAGAADFVEVAQIALGVLAEEDGLPADAAIDVADGIRHLLVDEFQDTSRRQHELLRRMVAAWPEREGRTCFVVGDPMQSIYFFRQADAELFPRVRERGIELHGAEPLPLEPVQLTANFRTARPLVERLNGIFAQIFVVPDGSGIAFAQATPAREDVSGDGPVFALHLDFVPASGRGANGSSDAKSAAEASRTAQTEEMVELIRGHLPAIELQRERGESYRVAVLARAKKSLAEIAEALREAAIPFRAVDLVSLAERPEVEDALALARALMNPQDRVAWLGVLRAPWCGMALADLHTLVSEDDAELLARSVPELLAERAHLLSEDGAQRAQRVLDAIQAAPGLRGSLPSASPGTWLEQVWLRLGGAQSVDVAEHANVNLLWNCLDNLPNGEQDLLSPALDAALKDLTAQPDPEASSDCGVQLMTIHKAKGLEFEVVIVPDLHLRSGRGKSEMLSWLERGIAPDGEPNSHEDSGEITEFLVAPQQSKGDDAGKAKKWVDGERKKREKQEERRVLYVAATRAREQLHLFARPPCKVEKNGELALAEPKNSLLAIAWPALEEEVRARFEAWKAAQSLAEPEPATRLAIAAGAALFVASEPARPAVLRRLPADFQIAESDAPAAAGALAQIDGTLAANRLYERHEGGLESRAFGIAVHRFMEEMAKLRIALGWDAAIADLKSLAPRIASELRAFGLERRQADEFARRALATVVEASRDPVCRWILSPHAEAASEARFVGVVSSGVRTVQVDRVFRAGAAPLADGDDCWWIVDYKTAHEDGFEASLVLPRLRELFTPQLEAYATVLRNLHRRDARICAGLYYPRLLQFDWWEM